MYNKFFNKVWCLLQLTLKRQTLIQISGFNQSSLCEERRSTLHNARKPVVQPDTCPQRRRCRRCGSRGGDEQPPGLGTNAKKLGTKLAIRKLACGQERVIPSNIKWRETDPINRYCSPDMAIWPDVRRQPVLACDLKNYWWPGVPAPRIACIKAEEIWSSFTWTMSLPMNLFFQEQKDSSNFDVVQVLDRPKCSPLFVTIVPCTHWTWKHGCRQRGNTFQPSSTHHLHELVCA